MAINLTAAISIKLRIKQIKYKGQFLRFDHREASVRHWACRLQQRIPTHGKWYLLFYIHLPVTVIAIKAM